MNEVEELLKSKNIEFKPAGKDVLVRCLNPEHDDARPSMRIDREEGVYHCLSCGYRGNIFTLFNKHRNKFNSKVRAVREKISEIRQASWPGLSIPDDAFFVDTAFDGYDVSEFKAFQTFQYGLEDRIVFPLLDSSNRIVLFHGRLKNSDASPKYLNYPKEVSFPFTPNQFLIDSTSLVLVEGIRDMLHLRHNEVKGAVCIGGTKTINYDTVEDLLTPYILRGVNSVYILMDGDKSGRDAAEHIYNCITRKTDLFCEIIDMPQDTDPAELNEKQVNYIKALTSG